MGTSKKKEFNKVVALDELILLLNSESDKTLSGMFNRILISQNYLQTIHDKAFAKGFESGCDAQQEVKKNYEDN